MLVPKVRFLEQDDTAGRKISLLQAPPIHDSRIDAEGHHGIGSRRKLGHVGPRKNFKRHVGGCCAKRLVCIGVCSDDAGAEIGFKETIDRRGGGFRDRGSHIPWNEAFAFAVGKEGKKHHNGVARQPRYVCQQRVVGEIKPVERLKFRIAGLNGFACCLPPATVEAVASADHHKPTCPGLKAFCESQSLFRVVFADHAGDVGRQFDGFVSGTRDVGKYHGDAGPDHVAILLDERNSCEADHHH
jgi:hypothetical protein